MPKVCIALDAMGGDNGPAVIVPAALQALKQTADLHLILVGDPVVLQDMLKNHAALNHPRLSIHAASQVVGMNEPPAQAMRMKRDSSMRVAINLVKEGRADACVSAGNTGALMAIARFVLKTLVGIDRPAIISKLPTLSGAVYMLDLGANVDCSAEHLLQFAVMGSVLVQALENIAAPKIGLLNIGAEPIKGSELIKKTATLLQEVPALNFSGFIEGDDIYKGRVNVVVCDGFVGNVALKTSEGLAHMIFSYARQEFSRYGLGKLKVLLAWPLLKALKRRFDPGRYNGASLVGLKGIVIKSHGNANVAAFCTAIGAAIKEVEKNVPVTIAEQVALYLKRDPLL